MEMVRIAYRVKARMKTYKDRAKFNPYSFRACNRAFLGFDQTRGCR